MLIASKYKLQLSQQARRLFEKGTPKKLDNVETIVTGSVRELCAAAAEACRALGYEPTLLTDRLNCEAKEAGRYLANVLKDHACEADGASAAQRKAFIEHVHEADGAGAAQRKAFIAGGETVVKLTGTGLGGRNQELALAAADEIAGMEGAAVFSVGSDGTDGPTDAAGGYVDGDTKAELEALGIAIDDVLANNDSYHALEKVGGLIITGPTGTNVNDVAVALYASR